MAVLLDTNALLWQLGPQKSSQIGVQTKKLIQNSSEVYISSISIVEMRIKQMLGKLKVPDNLVEEIKKAGDTPIAYSAESADTLSQFPNLARHDPFDRMLLAQAKAEGLKFITSDKLLLNLGLPFVVDARN